MNTITSITRSVKLGTNEGSRYYSLEIYSLEISRSNGKFVASWSDRSCQWHWQFEPPFQPDDSVIVRVSALLAKLDIAVTKNQVVQIVEALETKEEKFERRNEPVA
jgi:hypothetical protein